MGGLVLVWFGFFWGGSHLFFVYVSHAQKFTRFFCGGPFPEWTFVANTFGFGLNWLSKACRWVCTEERLCMDRPKSQDQWAFVKRDEIGGIFFSLLFLHVSLPSFPLLSIERACFFDFTNLSEADTEGTLRRYYHNEWCAKSFLSFSVSSLQYANPLC